MRRLRISVTTIALGCMVCSLSQAVHADIAADFLAEAKAAAADVKALDAAWYGGLGRLAAKSGAKSSVVVVRARLNGVIQKKPASMEIILLNGKPFAGKAWAPKWNTSVHRVNPAALTLGGNPSKGKLGGSVSVVFVPDHRVPFEGKPLHARVNINAQVVNGKVTGNFSASGSIPKASGSLSGTVQAASGVKAAPAGLPVSDLARLNSYDLYATAVRLENEALEKYRQIRVFEAVGRTGGDVATVLKGYYPLLIQVRVAEKAPKGLGLRMHVVDSGDFMDVTGWHADVKRNRGILERIVKYRPDSNLAKKARTALAQAKP